MTELLSPRTIGSLQVDLDKIRNRELDMIKIVCTPTRAQAANNFLKDMYSQFDWALQAYNANYIDNPMEDKAEVNDSHYEIIQRWIVGKLQGDFNQPMDANELFFILFFINPITDLVTDFYINKTSLLNILGVASVQLSPDPEDVLTMYDINKFIEQMKVKRNNWLKDNYES